MIRLISQFLFHVLIVELIILSSLIIAIMAHRAIINYHEKKEKNRQELLVQYFLKLLEKNQPFDLTKYPGQKNWYKSTLVALEQFGNCLKGDEWERVHHDIVENFLLPRARKWINKFSWWKRNFSARVFRLYSLKRDEEILLKLISDPHFLVRAPAAFALVAQESRKGIIKILQAMHHEKGYAQFLYRDAILKGSTKILKILINLASDPTLHLEILDILGAKSWGEEIPFLKQNLDSKDPQLQYLSLKVLIRNPLLYSSQYFKFALSSPNPQMRLLALQGMRLFHYDPLWDILENGLNDSNWKVRVEAGKILKEQGEKGIDILKKQREGMAQEAAQFVLNFE